jgi:NAD(P)-dependent dehydrogenase (short-subunit alcohol dehydrogenase family)
MTGRVCVVTGATSGIGFVTAQELARAGASVVVVGRNPGRTADTVSKIVGETRNPEVRGFVADLFLQREVRRVAAEILAVYPAVHVLVNDAGAMFTHRTTTAEGVEQTWALNVVTPFLLTHLFVPKLEASAPSRVVNVASAAHRGVRLDFDNLQGERHYSGYGAYGRSKLALVLMTYEFARRLAGNRVTVNALHPGFVRTGFGRNNPGGMGAVIGALSFLFGIRPARGARTSIYLASDPSLAEVTGKYFDRQRAVASSPASYEAAAGERLWDVLSIETSIPADALSRVG